MLRSGGDEVSLAFDRFEAVLQSKSLADAYGLCLQDAVGELTADFDLCFPMVLSHLTLRPYVLHDSKASQTGSKIFDGGIF